MVKKIVAITILLLLMLGIFLMVAFDLFDARAQAELPKTPVQEVTQTTPAPQPVEQPKPSINDPASLWVIANKQRPLPYDYVPSNLVTPHVPLSGSASAENMHLRSDAAAQLEAMNAAIKNDGLHIALISGYRSAATQKQLYNGYVAQYGQAQADRFSARPGTSEHQTGLAFDLGATSATDLQQSFGATAEGIWLAAHAHEFGFIVRYPDGKESITGYMYEPWHLRYVGAELATDLHNHGHTLEEHFGL